LTTDGIPKRTRRILEPGGPLVSGSQQVHRGIARPRELFATDRFLSAIEMCKFRSRLSKAQIAGAVIPLHHNTAGDAAVRQHLAQPK